MRKQARLSFGGARARGDETRAPVRRRRLSEPSFAFLLNAPALLAIVGLVGYPIAYSLWLSLHRYNLKRPNLFRFIGFGNYVEIFGVRRVLVGAPGHARLHRARRRPGGRARHPDRAPAQRAVPGPGLVRTHGPRALGDPAGRERPHVAVDLRRQGRRAERPPGRAPASCPTTGAGSRTRPPRSWRWSRRTSGTRCRSAVILLLAALQTIPAELYDAGRVDGSSAWQLFRHVTMPWLAQPLLVVLILQTMLGDPRLRRHLRADGRRAGHLHDHADLADLPDDVRQPRFRPGQRLCVYDQPDHAGTGARLLPRCSTGGESSRHDARPDAATRDATGLLHAGRRPSSALYLPGAVLLARPHELHARARRAVGAAAVAPGAAHPRQLRDLLRSERDAGRSSAAAPPSKTLPGMLNSLDRRHRHRGPQPRARDPGRLQLRPPAIPAAGRSAAAALPRLAHGARASR